jgi:hypothetical protein
MSISSEQARLAFVNEMEKEFNGWSTSPQLGELFAMANGIPSNKASLFKYMKMSTTGEDNEFKQGLKAYSQGEQLGTFTQILSGNVPHAKQLSSVSVDAKREDVEAQLVKEQEKKELALAKVREEQKHNKYIDLLTEARHAFLNELWDEAIANLDKAAALYPEKTEVIQLKADCLNAKSIAEYRQQEQRDAEQKFSQPLAEVIKGKTSAGNLVGTTVKWLKTEEHTFGQSEYNAFIAGARHLPTKEQKNLKSKLSALAKIVGKDVTDELCSELGLT